MRKLVMMLALAALALAPAGAVADDTAALKAEAARKVQGFFKMLKGELQAAMKKGGPLAAIEVCHVRAPEIADASSTGGWTVARTSLKLRNPGNAPDAWEREVLKAFDTRKAKGEDPAKLVRAEIVDEGGRPVFRFMKAIPTAKLCLNCHGAKLKPEVAAKLDELYPGDKARGYKAGDIRGAFTLRKPL